MVRRSGRALCRADGDIHLRGLHYKISSHGGIARPNGQVYVNDDTMWQWLIDSAANAARWLGYVPFSRLRDERNAPPQNYLLLDFTETAEGWVDCGETLMPPNIAEIMPRPLTTVLRPRQPYLPILLGEKSSLHSELAPVAEWVEGLLYLPTGEISSTLVADMARRIATDGRPAVVIYFADFDPAGHQMSISVARKLQALKTLRYDDLDVRLIRSALTRQQAEEYDLPSTPLKETEKRGTRWRAATGREQTELDAMIALHPGVLRRIAREAIAPFFDDTLKERCAEAVQEWRDEAQQQLEASPGYPQACSIISDARERLAADMRAYNAELDRARALLPDLDDEIEAPEAEIDEDDQPEPLFTTDDDFVEATGKLIASKNLEDV